VTSQHTAPHAATVHTVPVDIHDLANRVLDLIGAGARFTDLYATALRGDDSTRISAVLVQDGTSTILDADLPADKTSYPSLTAELPAAFWYERQIHDLFGLVPEGHPRLDPLVLPLPAGTKRPRPGSCDAATNRLMPDELALPRRVIGKGMFTIPHGPVRSGVFESIEYLVETPGEDVAHIQVRVYAKHRGLDKRFETLDPEVGVLLAERVEGIASVAHALAYAHAVETIAGLAPPPAAMYVRVLHAELERIANHLDVIMRLCDAAGLAVATSRFAWHKERILRLVGALCGSRFGRGLVTPGGIHHTPLTTPDAALTELAAIAKALTPDADLVMTTASFLDRLRGTGVLDPALARSHGALGPVGRASGVHDDARLTRTYDAYPHLPVPVPRLHETADVLARTRIRFDEIDTSLDLARRSLEAVETLSAERPSDLHVCVPKELGGRALGWAEAPQGELLYALELDDGHIIRCAPRTASFHNLVLFHETFHTDILTDFPFIEASFALSIAGVVN
jgi:Ni,Fe-hydrogenase III large subunit